MILKIIVVILALMTHFSSSKSFKFIYSLFSCSIILLWFNSLPNLAVGEPWQGWTIELIEFVLYTIILLWHCATYNNLGLGWIFSEEGFAIPILIVIILVSYFPIIFFTLIAIAIVAIFIKAIYLCFTDSISNGVLYLFSFTSVLMLITMAPSKLWTLIRYIAR